MLKIPRHAILTPIAAGVSYLRHRYLTQNCARGAIGLKRKMTKSFMRGHNEGELLARERTASEMMISRRCRPRYKLCRSTQHFYFLLGLSVDEGVGLWPRKGWTPPGDAAVPTGSLG
jgi:hypothetical protein